MSDDDHEREEDLRFLAEVGPMSEDELDEVDLFTKWLWRFGTYTLLYPLQVVAVNRQLNTYI